MYSEVSVSARNASFAGEVWLYTSDEQLRNLAEKIRGFPATSSDTREFILGGFGPQWAGGAVHMCFRCEGSVGHSLVELQRESGPGMAGIVQTCHLFVSIEASGVDEFVPQLLALANKGRKVAVLPAWYPLAEEMIREDRER